MDISVRDEIILRAISKTSLHPHSCIRKIFEMSFHSYDVTLMALNLATSLNISPEAIVDACFPRAQERQVPPKSKFIEEPDISKSVKKLIDGLEVFARSVGEVWTEGMEKAEQMRIEKERKKEVTPKSMFMKEWEEYLNDIKENVPGFPRWIKKLIELIDKYKEDKEVP